MHEEFFLFLSSVDSKHYRGNTPDNFTVQLSREIQLEGNWTCALTEISFKSNFSGTHVPSALNVCTNICDDSCVGDYNIQILRRIPVLYMNSSVQHLYTVPYFIPVVKNNFNNITVYITDENLNSPSIESEVLCTIQLKKLRYG